MATIVQQDGGTDKVYPEKNRVNTSSYTNENQSLKERRKRLWASLLPGWAGAWLGG